MCDMCSSPEVIYRIELEGSVLNVCEKCASYGRIIVKLKREAPEKKKKKQKQVGEEFQSKPKKETETIQLIVPNYPLLIKYKRERLGLKQKEVAKKIAEKESIIHKLESGRMKPGIPLARKLERFLRIKLIEEVELDESGIKPRTREGSSESMTLGDLVNIK